MPIDAAAKVAFGVVQVHSPQVVKAHDTLKAGKGFFAFLNRSQIVACSEGVTGIDTDADAGFILYAVNDGGKVFKLESQITAWPAVFSITAVTP